MLSMNNTKKAKRLPKSKRAHTRRLKQEAQKAGTVYKPAIM